MSLFQHRKIIFPFYHIVSDEDCPHVKHLYKIKRIKQFEKELNFLQKHYRPIGLEELTEHISNQTQPEKPSFFLSLDDGLRECFTVIAPILKQRKIPAAFFLNTGFVGNKDLFYRYKVSLIIDAMRISNFEFRNSRLDLLKLTYNDSGKIDELANELNLDFNEFLQKEKPYMSCDEIEELKNLGFYFGGHSVDHPYFNQISFEEQIRQTKTSVEKVVEKLNLDYRIFSFPFSDLGVEKKFFEKVYFENICGLTFGTAGIKNDEMKCNIQRLPMDFCTGSIGKFFLQHYTKYIINKILNRKVIH